MNINFELLIVIFILITGAGVLVDHFWLKKKRSQDKPMPWYVEYSRGLFPIFVLVLLIRSFIYEPFRIPSGSLEPTLKKGDFILVNKFDYGLRMPLCHSKFVPLGLPHRGDIVVFRWPVDPSVDFIKRVIGLPGDHISYVNKELFLNGKPVPQTNVGFALDGNTNGQTWQVEVREEDLAGIKHKIYVIPTEKALDFKDIVVPQGQYFVMGDNRDDSKDSRYWGFVPEANLVGKADVIWFSWNGNQSGVRWSRIGSLVH